MIKMVKIEMVKIEMGCPMSRRFCETWECADVGHPPKIFSSSFNNLIPKPRLQGLDKISAKRRNERKIGAP